MNEPTSVSEYRTQGHTGAQERANYIMLTLMGIAMATVCLVLELVLVTDPNNHGFWALFSLIGAGMAIVFGYILKHAQVRLP